MIELTQTILSLDTESEKALKMADLSALEAMKKADEQATQMFAEAQHLFEKKKEQDMKLLKDKLVEKHRKTMDVLKQKMDNYNNTIEIEALTEELFSLAKEHTCR